MTKFYTSFRLDTAILQISGDNQDTNEYFVEFIDINNGEIVYSDNIFVNYWSKLENISEKNITIRVTTNDHVVFEKNKNEIFNRIYVLFGSKALGDNIAWIPYVEEYRKIYSVEVIVHTHYNYLFDKIYPNLIFTDIDSNNIYDVDKKFRIDYGPELYRINGVSASDYWYVENKKYDNVVNYFDYRMQPLQHIAPLILGLSVEEITSKINIPDKKSSIKGKYVVVAMQSTSQLKYWNNPFGWERLFNFLERNGYKIVMIDRYEKFGIPGYYNQAPKSKNVVDKTGNISLLDRIVDIKHADMIITISSGLAWVAWAVGTPVVMISGFTKPWNEFKYNCTRIFNDKVCNGCWNDMNIIYDASKWLFCPKNNDFICSKVIQPKDVIDAIKPLLK